MPIKGISILLLLLLLLIVVVLVIVVAQVRKLLSHSERSLPYSRSLTLPLFLAIYLVIV